MWQKRTIYICFTIIFISFAIFLLVKISPIMKTVLFFFGRLFTPFIIAILISYILHPVLLKLHQLNISKAVSVLIIYLLFFTSIGFLFYKSFPVFIYQLQDLSTQLPQLILIYEEIVYSVYESTSFLPEIFHERIDDFIINFELAVEKQIDHILNKVINIFDFVIIITIIPVLVFYFLKDYSRMKHSIRKLVPYKYYQKIDKLLIAIDESFGGYIRGQLIISSIIIFVTFIIYHTINLKYAFVLAVLMGFMNVIPYFGPIIGTIPVVLIAMTMSWKLVIIVLVTTILVQIIEGSILSPYVMGKSVQIHPVMIIFILLVGAEIGGIIGMIVAVPTVTILKAIIVQIIPKKQQCN